MQTNLTMDQFEQLARKRASAKLGWLMHATVYALVNTLLVSVSLYSGKPWAVFPLLGWGLGLAIHGAAVWFAGETSALHERLLQRERQRLAKLRDPW
jgi:2TM domain